MRAAVFHEVGQALTVETIEVDAPAQREVLVDVAASGVCHSDLHFVEGLYDMTGMGGLPAILGHEGAGIAAAVGDSVTQFAPGDHVISCPSVFCGNCDFCLVGQTHLCQSPATRRSPSDPAKYTLNGEPVTQFAGLSTYAEQMLVHENALVKIRDDMPLDKAALIGCGVTTGVGAVLNTAKVEPGSTVAVFGAGGIGLSAIQGARLAGARTIIAVDTVEAKLGTARDFGATHSVDASSSDPVEAILFRMEQQGLTRKDLEPLIGTRTRVAEVLNRKRGLSIAMIRRLHDQLGIPAEVLIRPSWKDEAA